MNKRGLLIINALLWAIASSKILQRGIPALIVTHPVWVLILAALILVGFLIMFAKVSTKYTLRIKNLEGDKFPFYRFMSLKGYLLIGFMMSLGIAAGMIPGMPIEFFACFYPGLGSGLAFGAICFAIASSRI